MSILHLSVRFVHVVGMGLLVGGGVGSWGYFRWTADRPADDRDVAVAAGYEWLFWGVIGVLVMTGVGNLGAMAPAIPAPDSSWGTVLSAKVLAVLGLLVGSVVRTIGVARQRDRTGSGGTGERDRTGSPNSRWLHRAYGTTAVYLIGLVALAEVLAHG